MFSVTKRMEICGAHMLKLPYKSPCCESHGHNWIVEITIKGQKLTASHMLVDFSHIKQEVHGKLDHKLFNDVVPGNPTAENIAYWISERVQAICPKDIWVDRVSVQESEGNIAVWER